jgi:hypothetical protein
MLTDIVVVLTDNVVGGKTNIRSSGFSAAWPGAERPPEFNAKVLEIAETKVAMYDAYASEMAQTPTDEAYLNNPIAPGTSACSRPATTVSATFRGSTRTLRSSSNMNGRVRGPNRWLRLSSNSKQILAHNNFQSTSSSTSWRRWSTPPARCNHQTKRPAGEQSDCKVGWVELEPSDSTQPYPRLQPAGASSISDEGWSGGQKQT